MYRDGVILVIEAMRSAFDGGPFKAFYDGDPDVIPTFNLPAIVVSKPSDTTTTYSNAEDEVNEQIVIKVVVDKKADWTAQTDQVQLSEALLREYLEARDSGTGRYLPNTVKGGLRNYFASGVNGTIDGDMTTQLGIQPRPNDVITHEAHLTITLTYSVERDM